MNFEFPAELLRPRSLKPMLIGQSVGGGATLVGPEQMAELSAGGFWGMEYDLGDKPGARRLKLIRALAMRMSMGAAEFVMPFLDEPQAPWPDLDPALHGVPALTPFSDGSTFSDGSQWVTNRIAFEAVTDLSETGGEMSIRRIAGADLIGGEFMTLVHATAGPRVYCLDSVEKTGSDTFDIGFGPPAREPIGADAFVDFENPRCVMKSVPGQNDWPTITRGWRASSSLKFVESFDYLEAD